ncbi:unnamed protein product [Phytomonas sp. Hart1]|nr:unnamed protein product [Phytomonas sp. Hart1]|eukprot:CCW66396.1 unnamed protein product [Phytomonas sp. isolate Hart1]
MSSLDVEELLQQLKRSETADQYSAAALISFMEKMYFVSVSKAAYFVLGISLVAIFSISCVALTRKLHMRIQGGLEKAKAGILTTYFTARMFTLLIDVWIILIALSTVFSLMKMAAIRMNLSNKSHPLPKELCEWLTAIPILLFIPKFLGAFTVWLYVILLGGFLEIGVASSLLVCFPAFYESLCLTGKEPDKMALWVTHSVFFLSVFVAYCMCAPWLMREFRYSVHQIQGYTPHLSYYNRQEYKELKKYKQVVSKKNE